MQHLKMPLLVPTLIAACGTVLLLAQGPSQSPSYPHAFPRDGVTKLFDNARVTIWEVEWKTGGPLPPIHRHLYDLAAVYLRYGPIRVTTPDGQSTSGGDPFAVPFPYFQKAGITHREEGIAAPGAPTRLAIMVDLKDEVPPPFTPKAGLPTAFPRDGAKNVKENDRVRFWDYTWPAHKPTAMHVHALDSIEIYVDGGTVTSKREDGRSASQTFAWKSARFVPRGTVDSEEATAGTPRSVTIELLK